MQHQPSSVLHHPPTAARDAVLAAAIAALLSFCWALGDWAQLRLLNLPDTDDVMRLAQVRDWLGGQGLHDLTQYRLGPIGGVPMHWSRIADAGPAAVIAALAPLLGTYRAELAAILVYPASLFALYLFLSARIARAMGARDAAGIAILLAALAYPANALFLPGRIDHHGLQIVLIQAMILGLTHRPGARQGMLAGAALALSFGIGLETAPQAAVLMAVLAWRWIAGGAAERGRMLGFGAALAATTLVLLLVARPDYWTQAWCDSFTPASATGGIVGGACWMLLAVATPRLRSAAHRLIAGAALAAVAGAALAATYPVCVTGPYGPMPAVLRAAMIDNITEAMGVLRQPTIAGALRATGLLFFATLVAGWLLRHRPLRRDAILPTAAVLAISALLTLAQVRTAYIGAAVAAPVLAQLILMARSAPRRRTLLLAGAWTGSAGIVWMALPLQVERLVAPRVARAETAARSCRTGDVWRQMDRYRPGTVIGSIDHGARIIGASRHRALGAGYHRNTAGNLAVYDFFLSDPDAARAMARRWQADYIAFCPGDFTEVRASETRPGSIAARLERDEPPGWAMRLPLRDTGMRFYRIR